MTGGVNDVDEVLVPSAGSGSRGDSDASLLLLSHPVHGGTSLMHLPNLVSLTRVEQDALCACCLHISNMQPQFKDDNDKQTARGCGSSEQVSAEEKACSNSPCITLPASMCAMIPMFRYVSKGTSRGTAASSASEENQIHNNRKRVLCKLKVRSLEPAFTVNAWAAGLPRDPPWPHLRASCNIPKLGR